MDDPHRQDHHLFPGEPGPSLYFSLAREIAVGICVASEKVIFDISGKVYSQESHLIQSVYLNFQNIKNKLKESGLYNSYPQLKPVSEYLRKAVASEKISIIHEKLKGFKSFKVTISRSTVSPRLSISSRGFTGCLFELPGAFILFIVRFHWAKRLAR